MAVVGAAQGASYLAGGAYMWLDSSDLNRMLSVARGLLNNGNYTRLLQRTVKETAAKVRTIVSQEVPEDYEVSARWAREGVMPYRLNVGGGGSVNCVIPLSGRKGVHARTGSGQNNNGLFPASANGNRITSKVVKGRTTTLPEHMRRQGGNPPFMATMPNGYTLVMTRRTDKRLPIVRVVGVALPQMPMNRSQDDIEEEIITRMTERLQHNFDYMFGGQNPTRPL